MCKTSALSPDSLVLPLKIWKRSNKNQGMDSLSDQRALDEDLKELSSSSLEYLSSLEFGVFKIFVPGHICVVMCYML